MTTTTTPTRDEVMAELAELEDARILEVNERHGDDHAVNLTSLRAVAKRVKKNHPLALELWDTGDSAARLLALLVCRPKEFSATELDTMLREARTSVLLPKVRLAACSTMLEVGASTSISIRTLPSNVILSACGVTSIA